MYKALNDRRTSYVRLHTNNYFCIRVHPSMGSAPIGVQCPLTSSLGEFQGHNLGWLWCPGLPPVLVSIAFPFAISSIFRCLSIHSSSPAIEFHSRFFFTADVSASIRSIVHLLTAIGEFPGLGLATKHDVVVSGAEQVSR